MDAKAELFAAIKVGNLSAVQTLVDREASLVSARDVSGESAVMSAVYHRQQPIARLLIERGARLDVFEASAVGETARLEAALASDGEAVRRLSADGWTPLHLAAFFGHVRAAEVLLAHGAETGTLSKNATGNTPLHAALAGGHTLVAGVLIGAGADVNATSTGGYRPLHIAVGNGHLDSVKALIAQGADVNAVNDAGQTPLAVATHRNQKAVVEYLLRQGALS
jgi:ankyrin repeat protein